MTQPRLARTQGEEESATVSPKEIDILVDHAQDGVLEAGRGHHRLNTKLEENQEKFSP
jgi:hypothetical protein